jgi:spermidine synthase
VERTVVNQPRHVIADLAGCPAGVLDDEEHIRSAMLEAARRGGATVVDVAFHRFEGGGVTGVVMVKESHLTIHTWPERGYAALDVFLCGRGRPQKALAYLVKALRAERSHVKEHVRDETTAPPSEPVAGARRHMAAVYLVTLVVAMCSIVYELLLAQTLSALLGNTVLRYSLTIGCYLGALGTGALLCGSQPADAARRLTRIEIALSALGGLSVPAFYFIDMVQRYLVVTGAGTPWQSIGPVLFAVLTFGVIIVIGLLSGFEVPLLIALGDEARPRSANRVLGVDYFGSLLGSVLFPLVLLRSLGLLTTAFVVALLNVAAAFLLIAWRPSPPRFRLTAACTGVAAVLVVALTGSSALEQYFLKKFYFYKDNVSLSSLVRPQPERPTVARYRSPYQTIDVFHSPLERQWLYDRIRRTADDDSYPRDLWLYLNRDYQVYSGSEEVYHEWFVHAPVQAVGARPRAVLVLGGGDGIAIREILKYDPERIVHVEIDPEMLRLAREDPVLSAMNDSLRQDGRVEQVQDDAFHWLRTARGQFDAIYIDFPAPRDYNVAVLYSREFYSMVRHHLTPDGFVAIDTPSGWCGHARNLWGIYSSTLRAAGFRTVVPLASHINLDSARVSKALDTLAKESSLVTHRPGGVERELGYAERRDFLRRYSRQELERALQEFTVAFPVRRQVNTQWVDFGIPLRMFGPSQLAIAFDSCPMGRDPGQVNSLFRPTLPELALLSVRFP